MSPRMMWRLAALASVGIASCRVLPGPGPDSQRIPVLTRYPVDRAEVRPDSLTAVKLDALADAAREFADSESRLPESMQELLAFRRESPYVSPRPEWGVDGWNRQIIFALHANREVLLLLSRGGDGEIGGTDDLFQIVGRLR